MITAIHIALEKGAPMQAVSRAEVDRRGIVGDRNRRTRYRRGTAVTLVAEEDVAAAAATLGATIGPADTRRNVAMRGVDLAALVGVRFRLGSAVLFGVERCDPCRLLERRTVRGIRKCLYGGLRCDVLEQGSFAVGDAPEPV
jgi:MOSC domain-containing protein YiiM